MKIIKILTLILLTCNALGSLWCRSCQLAVSGLAKTLSFIIPTSVAADVLDAICMRRYDSQKLCKRVGQQIAPLAITNFIRNHVSVKKKCSALCGHTFIPYSPDAQMMRILNKKKPQTSLSLQSQFIEYTEYKIKEKETIKILQLSDVHLDSNYTENSSIYCDFPICCHPQNGFPENPKAQAKHYGSKNCDSPPALIDSFFHYLKKTQQEIDIVMVTGDISAHNQWQKNAETLTETQKQFYTKLNKQFPSSIMIHSEGNNDYSPDHQFNAEKDKKLLKVINIETGQKLLTFVSINTISYDQINLYVLGDQSYVIFQLMLLEQVLQKYQNVYLLGHIPPTFGGAAEEYSVVYRALVAKHKDNIKGQFYGHTHSDQLSVNTSPLDEDGKATGFAFVCPSLSPLYIGSSRARIYSLNVDGVNDYTQYVLKDLDLPSTQWTKQYSFRQKYSLPESRAPITVEEVAKIKQAVLSSKDEQRKYIRTTGLNEEMGSKSYCNLIDSYSLRNKCIARSVPLNTRIIQILKVLTGQWGYFPDLLNGK